MKFYIYDYNKYNYRKRGILMKSIKKFILSMLGIMGLSLFSFSGCSKSISFKSISPKDALEIIKGDSKAILIDVRTPEEYKTVRIPGSILVPDYEITDKIEKVVPDKNSTVILYCRSGRRSAQAAKELAKMGYTKVLDMGGIMDWPFDTESDE